MSSFLSIKDSPDDLDCTELEEIYQVNMAQKLVSNLHCKHIYFFIFYLLLLQSLLSRSGHERCQLLVLSKSENKNILLSGNSSVGCCLLCPDILVNRPALSCWFATCLFPDLNSFSLDLDLLHKLSKVVLLPPHDAYKVCFSF